MGGWIKVSRDMFYETPFRLGKPYSEFEAYLWLIARCDYEGEHRGTVAVSYPEMEKQFTWGTKKVRLFLQKLEKTGKGQRRPGKGERITMLEYDRFQGEGAEKGRKRGSKRAESETLSILPKEVKKKEDPLCIPPSENLDLFPTEKPKTAKREVSPGIFMTDREFEAFKLEAGAAAVEHYLPICSDWLKAEGKKKKDYVAFMRGWMRRDEQESKGFYQATRFNRKSKAASQFEDEMSILGNFAYGQRSDS